MSYSRILSSILIDDREDIHRLVNYEFVLIYQSVLETIADQPMSDATNLNISLLKTVFFEGMRLAIEMKNEGIEGLDAIINDIPRFSDTRFKQSMKAELIKILEKERQ